MSFLRDRIQLGLTRAVNDKLAIRGCISLGYTAFDHEILLPVFFSNNIRLKSLNYQGLDLQARYFMGRRSVGSGFFAGPMVQLSRMHLSLFEDNPVVIGSQNYFYAQSRSIATGVVIGFEGTNDHGVLYDLHLSSGFRMVEDNFGDIEPDGFMLQEIHNFHIKFGISVGWAHHHDRFVPPTTPLDSTDRRVSKNALMMDPSLILMKGMGLCFIRAINRQVAIVANASVIRQTVNDEFQPFFLEELTRNTYGLAVRRYFNPDALIGPYFSLGYNLNHYEYEQDHFFFEPFGRLGNRAFSTTVEDYHEVETILGFSAGNNVIFFDIGIKQGLRFAHNNFNPGMDIPIFKPGSYTFVHTGLGISF